MLLFAAPAQRNDLAVLRNIFGVGNLGDFFQVSVQPLKGFHSFLYRICVDGVGRIGRQRGKFGPCDHRSLLS
jgi:hypothetical protein